MSNHSFQQRELVWSQVDVFAEAPFEGNMLAIFPDANGLSDAEMQALARETNLSETTFILPRIDEEEREHGIRVRNFTTREELPFAGHPTLGTASWLWLNHPVYGGREAIWLSLKSGTVQVRFPKEQQQQGSVMGELTQHDPVFGEYAQRDRIALALGLVEGDLDAALAPQVVSTGLPFLIVPLRSVEAVSRVAVNPAELARLLAGTGAHFPFCIAPLPAGEDAQWHARMPFYGTDDPATGSAAGCAVSYLVRHGAVKADTAIVIRQGLAVHRPSRIHAIASLQQGTVQNVRVSGRTIPVAMGRFILP